MRGRTVRETGARAAKSLGGDARRGGRSFVVNTIAGHPLVPRVLRTMIYRGMGLDVRTRGIFEACSLVGSSITIGANSYINREVLLQAGPSARITIGKDCHLAMRVVITTSSHDRENHEIVHHLPVTIGDRVWLGVGAIVLPGVTIADDVVIGAGAVVTKDCTEPGLYVGVPAARVVSSSR